MKNADINRQATLKVAKALGDLVHEVVFVGGAVVSLYIDDKAAEDVRPTKDVDLTFKIISVVQLEGIREKLQDKGFTQSYEDEVICRFRLGDSFVDIMSTHQVGWAPVNKWFQPGFENAIEYDLDGMIIRLMRVEYFVASKWEAFMGRGQADPRTSHDFEDIVYILNNCSYFYQNVISADTVVRKYLVEMLDAIKDSSRLQEAVISNLYYEDQEERLKIIMERINEVTGE